MKTSRDVLVIGGGVTGLATTLELERRGYRPVLASSPSASTSSGAAGLAVGGQIDNFTRVSHAHGLEFAKSLWTFGNDALEAALRFCAQHGVTHHRGSRYRLITTEAELTEARLATQQLNEAGFVVALTTRPKNPSASSLWAGLTPRVLAIQDEGKSGAFIDAMAMIRKLEGLVQAKRHGAVQSLTSTAKGIMATLTTGEIIQAEIAVLACHLEIGNLLPVLRSALVSVADQWDEVKVTASGIIGDDWDQPGTVYSANHTYEWGVVRDPSIMRIGGGRYLRPMAGIEATSATHDEKIWKHLEDQLGKTMSWVEQVSPTGLGAAGLDCRPCDELPIIGPMYGDPRLLVATGYMGSGITQGLLAGYCLAELIDAGKSAILPRRLWPERLRSLAH